MELSLDVPSTLASGCASRHGLRAIAVEGSITFDASGAVCGSSTSITIYAADPESFCENEVYAPTDITAGPDGALWFTTNSDPNGPPYDIGQITTDGETNLYSTGTNWSQHSLFGNTLVSADGALWYLPLCANTSCIEEITTDGSTTIFPLPDFITPTSLAVGPDGALWFTYLSKTANGIGRMTPSGSVTTYTDPIRASATSYR